MPNLKAKSNTYVGFRHAIVAGVAMPIVIAIGVGIIGGILSAVGASSGLLTIFSIPFVPTILQSIAIIIGCWYSAPRLQKTFVLAEPDKIATSATIWFVCFDVLIFLVFPLISGSFAQATSFTDGPIMAIIDVIIVGIVFYLASKKFLETSTISLGV